MAYVKIAIGLGILVLFILTLVLANLLQKSNKENGELTQRLKVSNEAVEILAKQGQGYKDQIKSLERSNSTAYEACESTAAKSDSNAFSKGVEVGKVLGAKLQCPVLPSSAPSSFSQPATAPAKTR